jgi:pyrroloquinoline quinone biosynthesis protein D
VNLIFMDEQSRPVLARGVRLRNDPITGDPLLLFPEGMLPLDDTTQAILSRCTGEATLASIITALAEEYEAGPETVRADVCECLEELREQMLVVLSP